MAEREWLRLRPARAEDTEALYALARQTGGGLTTLPADRAVLERRVTWSLKSFAKTRGQAAEDYYLFVAEDPTTGAVVGTTGIFARVGLSRPFYSYRLLHLTQVSNDPEKIVHTQLLQLVNDYAGATELGTLFLHPDWRGGRFGALLSKGRFVFMKAESWRFSDKVMAEIRGWLDENGDSPFWEAIGRHFFDMPFLEADRLSGMGNSQFIADLMPKFPIYTNLLPKAARAVIGKPHRDARGAVRLLEEEGFRFAGAVDIFDAGPCYDAPFETIRTLRKTRCVVVETVAPVAQERGARRLIGFAGPEGFCLTLAHVGVHPDGLVLPPEVADILGCREGDAVYAAPLGPRGVRR